MSLVYPPIYPWSAFESRRFLSRHQAPIVPEMDGPGRVHVHAASGAMRQRLLSEYDRVLFERVGVLQGEYGVSADGLQLFDRGGACISVNFPNEFSAVARMPFDNANDPVLRVNRQELYSDWDQVPLVERAAVFSSIYHNNYYHFSFELVQKFRLLRQFDVENVFLPTDIVNLPFQRDLTLRAAGARVLLPLSYAVRVRDPVIVQTYQSAEGLGWLRSLYQGAAAPAGRKYYVRRNPLKKRRGNNISETAAFQRLLEAHGFTVIDFGNGETPIQEQIHMLDGASVVLAAHGAGLTNLAYLQSPARVIEVFGRAVLSTSFMRISTALGLDHHVIISDDLDDDGNIVVEVDQLEAILRD